MRRRKLRGKKLLVASVAIGASSLIGCADEPVANLVAPPDDASTDAAEEMMDSAVPEDAAEPMDVIVFPDGPVANLVAPPDDAGSDDAGSDDAGSDDAGSDSGSSTP